MNRSHRLMLFIALLFTVSFLGLEIRLFHLQVVAYPDVSQRTASLHRKTDRELAARGRILSRGGQVLAESIPALYVYANSHWTVERDGLSTADVRDRIAQELTATLGETEEDLRARLDLCGYRRLLRRPVIDGDQILELQRKESDGLLPGVELERTWIRRYPEGPLAANVVGFVNAEGKGQAGIEQQLDEQLSGCSGTRTLRRDSGQRPMFGLDSEVVHARPGSDVHLTIDLVIQYFTEEALDQIMLEHKPEWAAAVVVDPNRGDILAMASRPGFDPNQYGSFPASHYMNRCVSYSYRPGSSFKPLMMGIILEAAAVRLDEQIDCRSFRDGGRVIQDSHQNGFLTPMEIMVESSNIGMSKLAQRLVPDGLVAPETRMAGFRRVRDTLSKLGFGKKPDLCLPAVTAGMLSPVRKWTRRYTLPSLSFGHEIAASPLQIAGAFQAVANGGSYLEPALVDRLVDAEGDVSVPRRRTGRRVFAPETSEHLREMMTEVVERGTGKEAALDGYSVAGKTSTARWERDATRYTSSFVGFAPASDPRLLVVVVVDRPTGQVYSGGKVAAPAVGEILGRGLSYLRVDLDRMQ
ncbi:MAG: penicillin-binding protein 2 [Planctomycetota bacterium]